MTRPFLATIALVLSTLFFSGRGDAEIETRTSPNRVELRGGSSLMPLAQAMAEKYMQDHPAAVVVVAHSQRGVKAAIVGTCDVAMATSVMPAEYEKLEQDSGVKLTRFDIFRDAVVVVVNPASKVTDLSSRQVRDIFRGAIVNWKDVGGDDAPITVVTPKSTSDVYETFKGAVLRNDAVVTPNAKHLDYVQLVAALTEDAHAIGLVGGHGVGALRPLTIDGLAATEEHIKAERYPIFRVLSLYVRDPVPPIAKDLIENYFLASDKGQAFVRTKGDIPIH